MFTKDHLTPVHNNAENMVIPQCIYDNAFLLYKPSPPIPNLSTTLRAYNLMYEHRLHQPLSTQQFFVRLLQHGALVLSVAGLSLTIGIAGFCHFENMSILDGFLNAAMLLGGMGPVKTTDLSDAGKLFAGLYALYAGLVFIALAGIMLAPVVHRVLHRFHWEDQ